MGRPDYNFWSASVGKYCRDATKLRNLARGNCREAQFERPQVLGDDAGRCESVRTTGEVVGFIFGEQRRPQGKLRGKCYIELTFTLEMY